MKTIKFYLKSIAIIILIKTGELNAQITNLSHAGGLGDYIGWQFNTSLDLDIVNEDPQRINFYTDAGSSTLNNLRMVIAGNGNVGVGNNTTPLSLFHLHQSSAGTSSLFHITNAGTGTPLNRGFDFLQEISGRMFFNQRENEFIRFQTLSSAATGANLNARVDINSADLNSISGTHDRTRVWIRGDFPTIFNFSALALLQLGGSYTALTHGHRNWMDYGTMVIGGSDNVYFGIKNEDADIADYDDHNDAVISWGDNTTVPDNLNDIRFIFTTEMGTTSGLSSQQDGQEMARISWNGNFGIGNFYNHLGVGSVLRPARRLEVLGEGGTSTDPQFRLTFAQRTASQIGRYAELYSTTNGDLIISPCSESTSGVITQRRVGINTTTPGSTLEINSTSTGSSGLQFTDLTSSFTPAYISNGKVLTVDAVGNVVLTNDLGGNFNSCGGSSALNHIMKFSNNTGTLGCEAQMQEDANGFVGMGIAPVSNQGLSVLTSTTLDNKGISVSSTSTTGNTMGITIYPGAFKNFQSGTFVSSNTSGSSTTNSQAFGHYISLTGDNFNNLGVYANIVGGSNTQMNYGVLARVTGAKNGASPANFGVNAEGSGRDAVNNYGVWAHGYHGINATGVYGYGQDGSEINIGVDGVAYGSDLTDNYGVRGQALTPGNSNYGLYGYSKLGTNNFGVWGKVEIWGTVNYGVYGEASQGNCSNSLCTDAAGYFNGDLFHSGGIYTSSDIKLKKKVQPLVNASGILSQLQVKSYEFDTISFPTLNLKNGVNYGLIAQDVELILPSFVKSFTQPELLDSVGNLVASAVDFKAVSYESFIPLLLKGFQEQQQQIDSLVTLLSAISIPKANPADEPSGGVYYNIQRIELSNSRGIILNQNEPNPFEESTTITYYIPQEIKIAKILFSTTSGSVINTAIIHERGEGQLQVYSSELSKGIYNYTLVCDGKIISTMKMAKQ